MVLKEGKVELDIVLPKGDVSRSMDVFYNPVMVSNRNISIAVLSSLMGGIQIGKKYFDFEKEWKIALPLCGTGIRALRFLTELELAKIDRLLVNDKRLGFAQEFKAVVNSHVERENDLKLSSFCVPSETKASRLRIFENDAELFLLRSRHFDYIDIDPFGSPNPFLASSIARLTREGILAITATDTAALSGTYKAVSRRKYWGTSLHNYMKHEIGLRMLIRKVQLMGVQFDKALVPILSYSKDHYYRVFFVCENTKTACDSVLKQHKYFLYDKKQMKFTTSYDTVWITGDRSSDAATIKSGIQCAGPIWTGVLSRVELIESMLTENRFAQEKQLLESLYRQAVFEDEMLSLKQNVGFYDLHELCSWLCLPQVPKFDLFLEKVNGKRCYFSKMGFYSNLEIETIVEILKEQE